MKHYSGKRQQTGITLIICMIVLLVITLMGLSSIRDTSMEERMAGNLRNRNLAFQAAESALREAEVLVAGELLNFNGTNGLYQPLSPIWGTHAGSWGIPSAVRTFSGSLSGVASQPVYIIEELEPAEPSSSAAAGQAQNVGNGGKFRITARAVGSTDTAVVILQSVYKN